MKQVRGFALPSAIFLLVILAMLGAFMTTFSTTQHVDSANDLQGSRGYRAARMGAEWVVAKICNGGSPCGSCRQVMAEFGLDTRVLIATAMGAILRESTVEELLPGAFGPQDLSPVE